MCGRISFFSDVEKVSERTGAKVDLSAIFTARYNGAPLQNHAIVFHKAENLLSTARWGLIPSWAKDSSLASKMINARIETLFEKPSFRNLVGKKRLIVPVDGFFEWAVQGKGPKQPYFIHRPDSQPFFLAGLWDQWLDPESGEPIRTFTIITREAFGAMSSVHDRMPVLVPDSMVADWINPHVPKDIITEVNHAMSDPRFDFVPISTLVNKPANDSPEILERVNIPEL